MLILNTEADIPHYIFFTRAKCALKNCVHMVSVH
jgi:hypothetical protein